MPAIGKGVEEIRVTEDDGAYRIIYFARRTPSRRRPRLPRGGTSKPREDAVRKFQEWLNEETRELR